MPAPDCADVHRYAFDAMASRHELHVATPDRAQADRAARAAIADVLRIEAKYTRYRDSSVTSTINRNAGGDAVAIDAETFALLRYADRCHALSEGRFDLSSGILRRAWDRMAVPLPFARVAVVVGDPLEVTRRADEAELEELRRVLESRLAELGRRAEDALAA